MVVYDLRFCYVKIASEKVDGKRSQGRECGAQGWRWLAPRRKGEVIRVFTMPFNKDKGIWDEISGMVEIYNCFDRMRTKICI